MAPQGPAIPPMPAFGQQPINGTAGGLSTGAAPWAQSLANGTPLTPNIGANSTGVIPSASQWATMSPSEQSAVISTAQSQGFSPADVMAAIQGGSPNWGPMGQAQYRSSGY